MKTKKPDIFLGITMGMLVLAAVLCLIILFVKGKEPDAPSVPGNSESVVDTGDTGTPNDTNVPIQSSEPVETQKPAENLPDIDAAGLKAKLDDSLKGLTSEWEVVVIDPVKDVRVTSAVNCKVDDWMTANQAVRLFVMGTAFQQVADGTLTEDQILADVKAMIVENDAAAGDRLVELVGGGSASKGRETVKDFAVANKCKIGFNRALSGSAAEKNYITAQQAAAFLELLCKGELVSKEASAKMLDILLTPVASPAVDPGLTGDNLRYGFVYDVESGVCVCAMGVVNTGERSYVVSVVSNKPVTIDGAKKKATELISETLPFFTAK